MSIKKVYFDQILIGSKTKEYRADNQYYSKLLKKPYSHILFHYYQKQKLQCQIDQIQLIPNSFEYSFLKTPFIYEISLSHPKFIDIQKSKF